jgi:subtilisin family serine protease
VSERKANYSNAGPRTDIFAPGTNIMGASYTAQTADSRNASFYKYKTAGTSMASPQVAGVLACALETYPAMTQAQAREYIRGIATRDQLTGGGTFTTTYPSTSYVSYNTLYGGDNLYLGYLNERTGAGIQFPKETYLTRPSTGRTYPRFRVRKYG